MPAASGGKARDRDIGVKVEVLNVLRLKLRMTKAVASNLSRVSRAVPMPSQRQASSVLTMKRPAGTRVCISQFIGPNRSEAVEPMLNQSQKPMAMIITAFAAVRGRAC